MNYIKADLGFKCSRALDIIAAGNANIDITLYVSRTPGPDEAVEADSMLISGGGAASNFAIAASRLGCKVGFIGCIGNDEYGKGLLKEFKEEHVDTSRIQLSKSKPTGMVLIIVEHDGSRRMIAFRGANLEFDPAKVDNEYIASASILHIASVRPQIAYNLALKASKVQTLISYDPGSIAAKQGLQTLKEILEKTSILFLNRRELFYLTGSHNVEGALKILKFGVKVIALKMGGEGSIILTKDNIIHIPVYKPERIIDTTGAGDVYAAAFITSLVKGRDIIEAGLFASVAAGIKVSRTGARKESPYELEVFEKLKRAYNKLKDKVIVRSIKSYS